MAHSRNLLAEEDFEARLLQAQLREQEAEEARRRNLHSTERLSGRWHQPFERDRVS